MNKYIHIWSTVIFLLFGSMIPVHSEDSIESLYSMTPYTKPIYNEAEVAIHTTRFNNWLNENYSKIDELQLPKLQEYLFYLIDSHVKNNYQRENIILPEKSDIILSMLFYWSETLQAFGGLQIYNTIRQEDSQKFDPIKKVPPAFSLKYENGIYLITSKKTGWQLKVPYNFMIGRMQDFKAANDQEMQLLIISTGAARHNLSEGHSQATLMLISTMDENHKKFTHFWKEAVGISESATPKTLENDLGTSYSYFDEATKLHNEYIEMPPSLGSMVVIYSGIDGPYQHNRQHFIDFLNTIQKR